MSNICYYYIVLVFLLTIIGQAQCICKQGYFKSDLLNTHIKTLLDSLDASFRPPGKYFDDTYLTGDICNKGKCKVGQNKGCDMCYAKKFKMVYKPKIERILPVPISNQKRIYTRNDIKEKSIEETGDTSVTINLGNVFSINKDFSGDKVTTKTSVGLSQSVEVLPGQAGSFMAVYIVLSTESPQVDPFCYFNRVPQPRFPRGDCGLEYRSGSYEFKSEVILTTTKSVDFYECENEKDQKISKRDQINKDDCLQQDINGDWLINNSCLDPTDIVIE
jgi:hypothetical protein